MAGKWSAGRDDQRPERGAFGVVEDGFEGEDFGCLGRLDELGFGFARVAPDGRGLIDGVEPGGSASGTRSADAEPEAVDPPPSSDPAPGRAGRFPRA